MFLNRDDDMRTYYLYTFCFLPDYAEKKYTKQCREKKVAYISRCIAFEMNSCEFARTTIDEHSTTRLCVVFNENKNESRKGIDNIQISQKREMTEDEENK